MRNASVLLALMLGLAGAFAWSARAGDGTTIEERLTSVEQRLTALEELTKAIAPVLTEVAPSLLAARLSANETAALATLRNIMSAQAQFQQSAKADEDQDGNGEYGGFLELAGGAAGRMVAPLVPPVLPAAFRVLTADGEVSRSGYFFKVFLPGKEGVPVAEPPTGFAPGVGQDAALCETAWCVYAWPVHHNVSGRRTFFMNHEGVILTTAVATYSGTTQGPKGHAAFTTPRRITGPTAADAKGADGNVWRTLN